MSFLYKFRGLLGVATPNILPLCNLT